MSNRLPWGGAERGAPVLLALLAGSLPALAQTGPYDELTNTYRPVTNFNVETTRGLQFDPAGRILMLDTHGSTLDVFVPGGPLEVSEHWPTLNNPIAFDVFTDENVDPAVDYALVLGGGTHALALHELSNGRIVRTLQLAAEAGDVVIDADNARAFVSVPGDNLVVQVGLPGLTLEATFEVAGDRPRFLSLDRGDPEIASDNVVFVTPELSGNNTVSTNAVFNPLGDPEADPPIAFFPGAAPFAAPFELDPPPVGSVYEGLPDEDLFRIDPYTGSPPAPTLAAVAELRNAGTLMFAHGRNPATGAYWMLNVDSLNTDALNEPSLNGVFAENRLTIASTLGGSPLPFTHTVKDLDQAPGGGYDARFSISLPTNLAFHPTGFAIVAGSASDQLRGLDTLGDRVGDIELPPGSIPRSVLFDSTGLLLLVQCWGTNQVRIYDVGAVLNAMAADPDQVVAWAPPPATQAGLLATLDLGADPEPAFIQAGREHFYDADNSADGRLTCGHCHPGGGKDGLGWNIQDFPHDHKDLMVTQSLLGIEDTFPYHWRGERDLEQFNVAFKGLLGGTELDDALGGDLEEFKAFVFSLQGHANPRQNPERVLDPTRSTVQEAYFPPEGHTAGDPLDGQDTMDTPNTLLGRFSCADCHSKPSGTVGDISFDDIGALPSHLSMDVAHFRQLRHKTQELVDITWNGAMFKAPRSGYGLSHDGDHPSVFDFLTRNGFTLDETQERDLAAFVEQADEGISPAAHLAWTVDSTTPTAVTDEIEDVLLGQAGASFTAAHWVSVAVIGTHEDSSATEHDLRWYYLPATGLFHASDPNVVFPDLSVGTQSWDALVREAGAARARFTILGLPPGNALRWAVDRDDDGLDDTTEASIGSNMFDPDHDDDGDPDGHEHYNGGDVFDDMVQADDQIDPTVTYARIDHMGAGFGKFVFVFNEPVTLEITATDSTTGHVTKEYRHAPRIWDTVTVQRLKPSKPAITFPGTYPIPSTLAIPNFYALQVEMTDLGGRTNTWSTAAVITPADLLVVLPFLLDQQAAEPEMPPILLQRTLEDLTWVGTPGTGPTFQATARVEVRYDVPELLDAYSDLDPLKRPNQSPDPYVKQVVVAEVLHYDSLSETWSVVPDTGTGLTVSAPTDRIFPDVFLLADPSDDPMDPLPQPVPLGIASGPFVLSTESDSSGNVTIDFTLSQALASGDRVKLNIIGIFERDVRDAEGPEVFWGPSVITYNMPATAEANRGISSP